MDGEHTTQELYGADMDTTSHEARCNLLVRLQREGVKRCPQGCHCFSFTVPVRE